MAVALLQADANLPKLSSVQVQVLCTVSTQVLTAWFEHNVHLSIRT